MSAYRHVAPLLDELDRQGVSEHWIEDAGKHLRLYYVHDGRRRFYIVSRSPSDHRWVDNALSDLRRKLGGRKIAPKSRRGRRRWTKPDRPSVLVRQPQPAEPGDNPFDVLARHPLYGIAANDTTPKTQGWTARALAWFRRLSPSPPQGRAAAEGRDMDIGRMGAVPNRAPDWTP